MSSLKETIARIEPPDAAIGEEAAATLRTAAGKDLGLGALTALLACYAAATRSVVPPFPKKETIICCADHGVAAMKVSAYPPSTTVQMTTNYLISRGAVANALSNFAGSDLLVADLGIAAPMDHLPGLLQKKIALGTKNCAEGPAMTRAQAIEAIEIGIELAAAGVKNGVRCFLPGEMGIANTTSSACVAAVFCDLTPEEATGRGTNISDARLKVKIDVVRESLRVNQPDPKDGIDVLAKVGGFEIGCITGILLGAAAHRAVVVIDGFNTAAAALIAKAIAPLSARYLIASHQAAEPAHGAMLKQLGLVPYMDMAFRLGEATGSSLAVNLLDAAVRVQEALQSADESFPVTEETMPAEGTALTDKTFDFYLQTLPTPSRAAMEACQRRLDNLAKPIDSLGHLEHIAAALAGILDDERPGLDLARTLLIFAAEERTPEEKRRTAAFAQHATAEVTLAHLRNDRPLTEAFDFGRAVGEGIAFSVPLVGVALSDGASYAPGEKAAALRTALLKEDGALRYDPTEFLAHVGAPLQAEVSALLGAIIAAAHNNALVVLDDEATEIVARYAKALAPALSPYLLHTQPGLLRLGITAAGGAVACLGFTIIDAALHILNDMKTFAETRVSVADDGPGKTRQEK
ncbi:MAG: nicotinate-nucleotide--dimethylbenzimidazole phosphoribosyltransferase [Schwartzia sp. (in: firmicutes)]